MNWSAPIKRALLGRPRATGEHARQLLPKRTGLPVFASDPLSSVAYAPQELLLMLTLAGAGALSAALPLAAVVATLFVLVVAGYRQIVRAYPAGGGAYAVARRNFGESTGLVAAGALLIGYVLTVAVSVAAGVAAIRSTAPGLTVGPVALALAAVVALTLANLRGARETGAIVAVPTYAFLLTMAGLLVAGAARCVGGCPAAPAPAAGPGPLAAVSVALFVRAFAAGAVALTGVEAISNGVGAFRYPQSRNAATTLGIVGLVGAVFFFGISALAVGTGAVPGEADERTVLAQVALAVFGEGPWFLAVQAATAAILVLAANTSYADFPRLGSLLAADRYLPRQLAARGDRLVFSNGILVLAVSSGLLLVVFRADVTALVPLYVVSTFTAFTLGLAGMAVQRRRERRRRDVALHAAGAAGTGTVLAATALGRFGAGAWLALVVIPVVAFLLGRVNRYYRTVSLALRTSVADPEPVNAHEVVIVVDRVDEAAARAVSYARALGPSTLRAVAAPVPGADVEQRWAELAPDVELRVVAPAKERGAVRAVERAVGSKRERRPGTVTTALLAESLSRSWLGQFVEHRLDLRLKSALRASGNVAVADLTSPPGGPGPYTVEEPVEHHVVVCVGAVNTATLRALAYGEALQPTSLRALSVNLDPERSHRLLEAWEDWGVLAPLEVVDSPFRALTASLVAYLREFAPDGRQSIVTCVLPEFVLPRRHLRILHNQSAAAIRNALLFERGVVTTTVPYPLEVGRVAARGS